MKKRKFYYQKNKNDKFNYFKYNLYKHFCYIWYDVCYLYLFIILLIRDFLVKNKIKKDKVYNFINIFILSLVVL